LIDTVVNRRIYRCIS